MCVRCGLMCPMNHETKKPKVSWPRWLLGIGAGLSVIGIATASAPDGAAPIAVLGGILLALGIAWS